MNPKNEWSDQEWNNFEVWLRDILKTDIITVTFTKKDGTERVMKCTTNTDVVPKVEVKEGAKPRKVSETTMRVFDTDIKEWRSFTIKSITQITINYDTV